MEGFTKKEAVFARTVRSLLRAVSQVRSRPRIHTFGTGITPITASEISRGIDAPEFYGCPSAIDPARCRDLRTRFSDVLSLERNDGEASLKVVVSDLMTQYGDIVDGHSSINVLKSALESGLAVGLIGIRAAFEGVVYNMPVADGKPYDRAQERPFFILLIGPRAEVQKVHDLLAQDGDGLRRIPETRRHFMIFSRQLVTRTSAWAVTDTARHIRIGNGAQRESGARYGAPEWLPHYNLAKRHPPLRSVVDLSRIQATSGLPLGGFQVNTAIWLYRDGQSCDKRWDRRIVRDKMSRYLRFSTNGRSLSVEILGNPTGLAMKGLPFGHSFLLFSRIRATKLSTNSAELAWLKKWSFSDSDGSRIFSERPAFLPTANLKELTDVLTKSVEKGFEPVVVTDFALSFNM